MVCRMEHFSYTPRVALAHLLCGKCGEVLWGPLAFTKPWTVFMVWVIIQQGLENDQFRNPCSPHWSQNPSNPYHFTRLSVNDVKLPMKCLILLVFNTSSNEDWNAVCRSNIKAGQKLWEKCRDCTGVGLSFPPISVVEFGQRMFPSCASVSLLLKWVGQMSQEFIWSIAKFKRNGKKIHLCRGVSEASLTLAWCFGFLMPGALQSHPASVLQEHFQISLYPIAYLEEIYKNVMYLKLQQLSWKRWEWRMGSQFILGRTNTDTLCTRMIVQKIFVKWKKFLFFLLLNIFAEKKNSSRRNLRSEKYFYEIMSFKHRLNFAFYLQDT